MSTNDVAIVGADMALKFSSPMATFLVGPQKFRFNVHKSVLCQPQAGSFFKKVFADGFQKAQELPEDGPAEVLFFVKSLYGVWMGTTENPFPFNCEDLKFPQKLKLYVFARRYACFDLQNAIISDVLELERKIYWFQANIRREDLECLDKHLPNTTPMHRLLSIWLIRDVFNKPDGRTNFSDASVKELPEFMVRAALEHVLRLPRPAYTIEISDMEDQAFMVPGDTAAAEQNKKPLDDEAVGHTAMRPSKRPRCQRTRSL